MGNWNITIRGMGAHHNKSYPTDANRMAAEFVRALRAAGHNVTEASITFGGADDLSAPIRYLDDRDHIEERAEKRERCAADLGPRLDGECPAKQGVFKLCPDPGCPMHGTNAPSRLCRLAKGHEGEHEPPVEWKTV